MPVAYRNQVETPTATPSAAACRDVDGSFQQAQSLGVGISPYSVAMGDSFAHGAFTPDGKRALAPKFTTHKIALRGGQIPRFPAIAAIEFPRLMRIVSIHRGGSRNSGRGAT